ncbi:MAG: DEAD/DEAH box helicase [Parvularculaceae bacterium]
MPDLTGVSPALAEALDQRGFTDLTPVQRAMLGDDVRARDLLVSARTGSGKTVAFGLSLAPTLLGDEARFVGRGAPLALVAAPTRELALQVRRELEWLYQKTEASIASCVGGMDMRDERNALSRGAQIVVGTPGRLVDHIKRGSLDLSQLRAVVLDEADEMLDLGFRDDLEFILAAAPPERRTLMFSATVSKEIAALAKKYQRDAVRVNTIDAHEQHADIEYRAIACASYERENAIINLLRYIEPTTALVFCATRATVNHLASRFGNRGFSVVALSGELSQKERTRALQALRDGRAQICIATDVAARGIDLPNLDLVIHADLPRTTESLLHRSGRTGRAGRKGVSVVIAPGNARKRIERLFTDAKISASWQAPPSADEVRAKDAERLVADPSLTAPMEDSEREAAADLAAQFEPQQIAAAFIRLYRAGRSAPEEVQGAHDEFAAAREKKKIRKDLADGAWFALAIGRNRNAEPRWLLPMLCKSGGLNKNEIGAIRITDDTSYVEIASGGVERLLQAAGASMRLEGDIAVSRLDAPPDLPPAEPGERVPRNKRRREERAPREKARNRPPREKAKHQHRDKNSAPAAPARDDYEKRLMEALEAPAPRQPSKPKKPAKPKRPKNSSSAKPKAPRPARAKNAPPKGAKGNPKKPHGKGAKSNQKRRQSF